MADDKKQVHQVTVPMRIPAEFHPAEGRTMRAPRFALKHLIIQALAEELKPTNREGLWNKLAVGQDVIVVRNDAEHDPRNPSGRAEYMFSRKAFIDELEGMVRTHSLESFIYEGNRCYMLK